MVRGKTVGVVIQQAIENAIFISRSVNQQKNNGPSFTSVAPTMGIVVAVVIQ